MNLYVKAIQRKDLNLPGDPDAYLPIYVHRATKTLVIPKRISISCAPEDHASDSVFGYPVLVHTDGSGTYPMSELNFVQPDDELWLLPRYAELLESAALVLPRSTNVMVTGFWLPEPTVLPRLPRK